MQPDTSAAAFFASMADGLAFDWPSRARPEQMAPPGEWSIWLILAGRGFGKTRTGSEWVRANACGRTPLARGRYRSIALIAETAADARDVIVGEGKESGSGLLHIHPKDFRPYYEPSKRRLTWPNGCIATLFNATEPDQLRGPEHDAAWCDEVAKWQYAQETWDMMQFGLRQGPDPRIVVTTTPRPIPLLKEIMGDPGTVITRGRTQDNAKNLSPKFLAGVLRRYEGTRLGRQELNAELLEDVPGALWTREQIDKTRVAIEEVPPLRRIVIGVDPAVTSGEDSDETGIVAVGVDDAGEAYVLEDGSGQFTPTQWATKAIALYYRHQADRVIAEVNQGGQMVETTVRMIDPNISYKAVHATRGKAIRAEPISALYEQGRVHHVGSLAALEDQMCTFSPGVLRARQSPDRMDALVWALTELMVGAFKGQAMFELAKADYRPASAPELVAPSYAIGSVEWCKADAMAAEIGTDLTVTADEA